MCLNMPEYLKDMNRLYRKILVFTIFVILFLPLPARGEQVVYYGAELPPLIHEEKDDMLSGFTVSLLREAVKAANGELPAPVIKSMPWARSLDQCRSDPHAALLALAMLPSRKTQYKWVGPIAVVRLGVYAMKSSNISIDRVEELSRYRIGAVRATAPTRFLLETLDMQSVRLEQVNNMRASIRMMRAGRLDLTVIAEPGFFMLLREMNISGEEFVRVYDLPPLAVYFAFNRHCDDTYISTLRAGLRALYARSADGGSSRYEALCRKYWESGSNATCAPVAR